MRFALGRKLGLSVAGAALSALVLNGGCGSSDDPFLPAERACATDAACPGDSRAPCGSNADCLGEAPLCQLASARCVQCLVDADCPSGGRPRCNAVTQVCVECLDDSQCDSDKRCNLEGRCN
jgi:Cys-rich repeat protein